MMCVCVVPRCVCGSGVGVAFRFMRAVDGGGAGDGGSIGGGRVGTRYGEARGTAVRLLHFQVFDKMCKQHSMHASYGSGGKMSWTVKNKAGRGSQPAARVRRHALALIHANS